MRKNRIPVSFTIILIITLLLNLTGASASPSLAGPTLPYPILFVTQVPVPGDFTTIGSVFGNHGADMASAARGGDLWIRYPDGTLKNLTASAGYGASGFQGANAIAVRDPAVHWSGSRALFSMIVGGTTDQYEWDTFYWQIYEVTGLGQNEAPVITKVPNQPANVNNVSPIYGSDDRIIFTSDRTRNGATHLHPQLDEYEEAPTNTGLWSLDRQTGDLFLLDHAPSGDFTPIVDSFGRVIFTRWDHLQRDQQADADGFNQPVWVYGTYGTFNYADESAGAAKLTNRGEVFPEPRGSRTDLLAGTNLEGHSFNHFFPWQINQDGSESETLNHIGRQELHGYIDRSLTDDPNLVEYYGQFPRFNQNEIENLLQIKEDPLTPGRYIGVDAPEFYTHASGQIVSLVAPPSLDADHIAVTYLTHRDTASFTDTPGPNHSGLYRDPYPLSNGVIIAAHTTETDQDDNTGTRAHPGSRYAYRIKTITLGGNGYYVANQLLTPGISESVSYWDPDVLVSYSGPLWELQPVEVRPRSRPVTSHRANLAPPEQTVFNTAGVNEDLFRQYLIQNNLALIVSRNVTSRDDNDRQQPFNLRVPGGVQTLGAGGKIYNVSYLQLFQGDQIRGLGGTSSPRDGRRVLAQYLHDPAALASNVPTTQTASVALAPDGSLAAFVPARRALSWQLTNITGTAVVRERYWVSFQPGEVRVCASCHGLNDKNQANQLTPTNSPQALSQALQHWQTLAAPNLITVTFTTTPANLTLNINGKMVATPYNLQWWKGYPIDLGALAQVNGGQGWRFSSWSDGGANVHTINAPASPATYTATFVPASLVWLPIALK